MAGRNCADIVFCIDASGSMQPCLDAVMDNMGKLIEGLQSDAQTPWDVRFDFLAFHDSLQEGNGNAPGMEVHGYASIRTNTTQLADALYHHPNPSLFFTRQLEEFRRGLKRVVCCGEEMHLLALDIAADYPWRPSDECHRVLILLTDEAVETGVSVPFQMAKIDRLIAKIMAKRIKLFIAAPESEALYKLSCADRCEYMDYAGANAGLENVDFSKLLQTIGKSVSVTQSYEGAKTEADPTYNQQNWMKIQDVTWSKD